MTRHALLTIAIVCFFVFLGACYGITLEAEETGETIIRESFNLELAGRDYDRLTLINCHNVDIHDCTLGNLILDECTNVDIYGCVFDGFGIAVSAHSTFSVDIYDCEFSPNYAEWIDKTDSFDIDVK
jgi:hypothetical protein